MPGCGQGGLAGVGAGRSTRLPAGHWVLPPGSERSAVTFGFLIDAGAARLPWCQGEARGE